MIRLEVVGRLSEHLFAINLHYAFRHLMYTSHHNRWFSRSSSSPFVSFSTHVTFSSVQQMMEEHRKTTKTFIMVSDFIQAVVILFCSWRNTSKILVFKFIYIMNVSLKLMRVLQQKMSNKQPNRFIETQKLYESELFLFMDKVRRTSMGNSLFAFMDNRFMNRFEIKSYVVRLATSTVCS